MLAQNVPYPPKHRDARVLLGRTTAALVTANDHLTATRECQETQRDALGKAR